MMRDIQKILKPKSEKEIRDALTNMHIFDIVIGLKRRKDIDELREIRKLLCFKYKIILHFLTPLDKWRIFIFSFYLVISIFGLVFNVILFPFSIFFSKGLDNVTLFLMISSVIFFLYMVADIIINNKFENHWLETVTFL